MRSVPPAIGTAPGRSARQRQSASNSSSGARSGPCRPRPAPARSRRRRRGSSARRCRQRTRPRRRSGGSRCSGRGCRRSIRDQAEAPGPIVLAEQADHEARSAVAALRSTGLDHRALDRVQGAVAGGDALDADNRLAVGGSQRDQAAVDRFETNAAARVGADHGDRARAALALGAAFLAAGAARRAQPLQQRGVGVAIVDLDALPVEHEPDPHLRPV